MTDGSEIAFAEAIETARGKAPEWERWILERDGVEEFSPSFAGPVAVLDGDLDGCWYNPDDSLGPLEQYVVKRHPEARRLLENVSPEDIQRYIESGRCRKKDSSSAFLNLAKFLTKSLDSATNPMIHKGIGDRWMLSIRLGRFMTPSFFQYTDRVACEVFGDDWVESAPDDFIELHGGKTMQSPSNGEVMQIIHDVMSMKPDRRWPAIAALERASDRRWKDEAGIQPDEIAKAAGFETLVGLVCAITKTGDIPDMCYIRESMTEWVRFGDPDDRARVIAAVDRFIECGCDSMVAAIADEREHGGEAAELNLLLMEIRARLILTCERAKRESGSKNDDSTDDSNPMPTWERELLRERTNRDSVVRMDRVKATCLEGKMVQGARILHDIVYGEEWGEMLSIIAQIARSADALRYLCEGLADGEAAGLDADAMKSMLLSIPEKDGSAYVNPATGKIMNLSPPYSDFGRINIPLTFKSWLRSGYADMPFDFYKEAAMTNAKRMDS